MWLMRPLLISALCGIGVSRAADVLRPQLPVGRVWHEQVVYDGLLPEGQSTERVELRAMYEVVAVREQQAEVRATLWTPNASAMARIFRPELEVSWRATLGLSSGTVSRRLEQSAFEPPVGVLPMGAVFDRVSDANEMAFAACGPEAYHVLLPVQPQPVGASWQVGGAKCHFARKQGAKAVVRCTGVQRLAQSGGDTIETLDRTLVVDTELGLVVACDVRSDFERHDASGSLVRWSSSEHHRGGLGRIEPARVWALWALMALVGLTGLALALGGLRLRARLRG